MRILSVGSLSGMSNTCLHRNWALHKVADEVDEINTQLNPITLWGRICYHLFFLGLPIRIPENNKENEKICKMVKNKDYDIVWIDKGHTILPSTLKYIKKISPNTIIVSYSPDNMALRHNQTQQYLETIPLYDYFFTNKSYILDNMRKLGAKNIFFVNNSYEETFHHPYNLTEQERIELGGDVGFVGSWEQERCDSILYLADNGIKVRVFGTKEWQKYKNYSPNLKIEDHGLKGIDYSKSLQAFKISLCFLRKINYDLQTSRSVEIPACSGFMMAERTDEHCRHLPGSHGGSYGYGRGVPQSADAVHPRAGRDRLRDGNRRRRAARQGDELLLEGRQQDQSADRFGRRFGRPDGRPRVADRGPEGRSLELPADARHGSQRGRRGRFGGRRGHSAFVPRIGNRVPGRTARYGCKRVSVRRTLFFAPVPLQVSHFSLYL